MTHVGQRPFSAKELEYFVGWCSNLTAHFVACRRAVATKNCAASRVAHLTSRYPARVPCAPNILLSQSHCDSVSGANMISASWRRSLKYSYQDDFLFWQKWLRYLPDVTVVPDPPCTRYTHDPFRQHTAGSLHATAIWLWDRTEKRWQISQRPNDKFCNYKKLTAKD